MIQKNYKIDTGILIRFDDIAPNMRWEMMDKCQNLLNEFYKTCSWCYTQQ